MSIAERVSACVGLCRGKRKHLRKLKLYFWNRC